MNFSKEDLFSWPDSLNHLHQNHVGNLVKRQSARLRPGPANSERLGAGPGMRRRTPRPGLGGLSSGRISSWSLAPVRQGSPARPTPCGSRKPAKHTWHTVPSVTWEPQSWFSLLLVNFSLNSHVLPIAAAPRDPRPQGRRLHSPPLMRLPHVRNKQVKQVKCLTFKTQDGPGWHPEFSGQMPPLLPDCLWAPRPPPGSPRLCSGRPGVPEGPEGTKRVHSR